MFRFNRGFMGSIGGRIVAVGIDGGGLNLYRLSVLGRESAEKSE